jgi:hypothetical protein
MFYIFIDDEDDIVVGVVVAIVLSTVTLMFLFLSRGEKEVF